MTSIIEVRKRQWHAEYYREARAEGLAQGCMEGMAVGFAEANEEGLERRRAMLSRLAARRFGADPGRAMASALVEVKDAVLLECDAELAGRWVGYHRSI